MRSRRETNWHSPVKSGWAGVGRALRVDDVCAVVGVEDSDLEDDEDGVEGYGRT